MSCGFWFCDLCVFTNLRLYLCFPPIISWKYLVTYLIMSQIFGTHTKLDEAYGLEVSPVCRRWCRERRSRHQHFRSQPSPILSGGQTLLMFVVVVEELITKELMCAINQKLTLGRNMRTTPAIMKITSKAQSIPGWGRESEKEGNECFVHDDEDNVTKQG